MNQAHIHLLLNHFPIIGSLFATVILAVGMLIRRTDMKRVALAMFIFSGIMVIPVAFSGEGAVDVLLGMGESDRSFIDRHEELGEWLLRTSIFLAVLAIVAFYFEVTRERIARWIMMVLLVLSIANGYLVRLTGSSGGEIRHPEIRTATADSLPMNSQEKEEKNENHD